MDAYEKFSFDCNRPNSRGCEINLQEQLELIKARDNPHFANARFRDVVIFLEILMGDFLRKQPVKTETFRSTSPRATSGPP